MGSVLGMFHADIYLRHSNAFKIREYVINVIESVIRGFRNRFCGPEQHFLMKGGYILR